MINPEAVKIMLREIMDEVVKRPGWYVCIGKNSWTNDMYCDIGTSDGSEPDSQNSHPTNIYHCIAQAHGDLPWLIQRWEEFQEDG